MSADALRDAVAPAIVRSLREQIDLLEEQVRQYREAAEKIPVYPAEWGLTGKEAAILARLARAKGGVVGLENLLVALYGLEPDVDLGIIRVLACKLRKKLAGTGIEIRTRWGEGFYLTSASMMALHRVLAATVPVEALPDRIDDDRAKLTARIAELEAENAQLAAAIAAASLPPAPIEAMGRPRRDWRDHRKDKPKRRPGGRRD